MPSSCSELVGAVDASDGFSLDRVGAMLKRKWDQYQGWGWQRDYDVATMVFKKLGLPVPEQVMLGGEADTRTKGGKDVATRLLKPVKRSGKRGKFLAWFLDADGTRSVREAMVEFSMTRSNALSYLYMLQKDHGIGYVLVGDNASVTLPEGCDSPFDTPSDDESWLD